MHTKCTLLLLLQESVQLQTSHYYSLGNKTSHWLLETVQLQTSHYYSLRDKTPHWLLGTVQLTTTKTPHYYSLRDKTPHWLLGTVQLTTTKTPHYHSLRDKTPHWLLGTVQLQKHHTTTVWGSPFLIGLLASVDVKQQILSLSVWGTKHRTGEVQFTCHDVNKLDCCWLSLLQMKQQKGCHHPSHQMHWIITAATVGKKTSIMKYTITL